MCSCVAFELMPVRFWTISRKDLFETKKNCEKKFVVDEKKHLAFLFRREEDVVLSVEAALEEEKRKV